MSPLMLMADPPRQVFEFEELQDAPKTNRFSVVKSGAEKIFDKVEQARQTLAAGQMSYVDLQHCLLYTSPSPRDKRQSRMPSSA